MEKQKKRVNIYISGKTSSNPGPGAWGAILTFGNHKKELNGYQADTDSDRMLLFAAISGLGALKESCIVNLCTESISMVGILGQHNYVSWRLNNWKDEHGEDIANKDLWLILSAQLKKHEVYPSKIGSITDENMVRCKVLASEAFQEYIDINTDKEANEDNTVKVNEGSSNSINTVG